MTTEFNIGDEVWFGYPTYDITSEYLDGSYCTVIGNIHEDQFREVTKKVEGDNND
jgi:hypothetical protein